MSLKRRSASGAAWALAEGLGQQVITVALYFYVARSITPAELGLVAFALLLMEILATIGRLGLDQAIQRERKPEQYANGAFWVLVLSGIVFFALAQAIAAASPGFGMGDQLRDVLIVIAPICLVQPVSAMLQGLLAQAMDFRWLAVRNWVSTIASAGVALYVLQTGGGLMALAWQRVIFSVVSTALLAATTSFRPSARFGLQDTFGILKTGIGYLVSMLATSLNQRLSDAITGLLVGPGALGLLRIGWKFVDLLNLATITPATRVAISALSQDTADLERVCRSYAYLTRFVSLIAFPAAFGLGATSSALVAILLGPQWAGAALPLQFLGAIIVGRSATFFLPAVMIAIGHARLIMLHGLFVLGTISIATVVGAFWGIPGVLVALTIQGGISSVYALQILRSTIQFPASRYFRDIAPPLVCSIGMAIILILSDAAVGTDSDWIRLGFAVLTGPVLYVGLLVLGDFLGMWRGYLRESIAYASSFWKQAA